MITGSRTVEELSVYACFAKVRGWPDGAARAVKRSPPEPDLCVTEPDGSVVAVEVVQLRGEDFGAMVGALVGTKRVLEAHFESLSDQERAEFAKAFGDAMLYFRFSRSSTRNQRKALLPAAFRKLRSLQCGFEGEALCHEPELLPTLMSVGVSRGGFCGPCFDVEFVSRLGDPTVERIRSKFLKRYSTPHPIELLAYIDGQPMFPEDVWRNALQGFLESLAEPSPFRRLWILDVRARVIRYAWPDGTAFGRI